MSWSPEVKSRRIGAIAAALVLSAACGGSSQPAPAATAAPAASTAAARAATATPAKTDSGPTAANPVTLRIVTPSAIMYVPFWVGVEQGIYLKHGIDLKVSSGGSGAENVKALQSGQAELAANTWPTLIPAVVGGVPIKIVGIVTGRPDSAAYDKHLAVIVRSGVSATDLKGMKGLKITHQFGGGVDNWLQTLLRNAGLNPDKDVQRVNAPIANQLSLLQSGAVDAAAGSEPYPSLQMESLPGSRVLVQGGGASEARILLAALGPWIANPANTVIRERFVAAHLEALQYTRQHPDTAAVAAGHKLSGVSQSVLLAAIKKLDYDPRWSSTVQAALDSASKDLVTSGTVKEVPKTADVLVMNDLNPQARYPQYYTDLK